MFGWVNDFHRWEAWSPWARLDPNMKQTFTGAPAGVGATQSWSGNKKVGEGRATIIESRPPELVRIKLEFLKPFAATNTAEFTFQPEGDHTAVTWSMTGSNNFMAKAFGLFMNMDKLIGRDFENGLAQLKAAAENQWSSNRRGQPTSVRQRPTTFAWLLLQVVAGLIFFQSGTRPSCLSTSARRSLDWQACRVLRRK